MISSCKGGLSWSTKVSRGVRLAPCDAQQPVPLVVDMGNMGSCQPIIVCCRLLEAAPLPQPLAVPLRRQMVRGHPQGLLLTRIDGELIKRIPVSELTRERILALAVSRRRSR
jgi:hypothetical protein